MRLAERPEGALAESVGWARVERSVGLRQKNTPGLHLVHLGKGLSITDRRCRDSHQAGEFNDFLCRVSSRPSVDHVPHFFKVFHAGASIQIAIVVPDILSTQQGAEVLPLLTRDGAQSDPAVLSRFVRRNFNRSGKRAFEPLGIQVVIDRETEHHRFEH